MVYVEWTDAATEDDWQLTEDAVDAGPHPAHTVGWLLKEDDKGIYIAHTYSPDDKGKSEEVMGKLVIPRGMLLKLVYIKR